MQMIRHSACTRLSLRKCKASEAAHVFDVAWNPCAREPSFLGPPRRALPESSPQVLHVRAEIQFPGALVQGLRAHVSVAFVTHIGRRCRRLRHSNGPTGLRPAHATRIPVSISAGKGIPCSLTRSKTVPAFLTALFKRCRSESFYGTMQPSLPCGPLP
jgi:hypothetical protein